jgi:hypothetical protein
MDRVHEHMYMVTVRKSKNKQEAPNAVICLFHQIPEELTNALIVTGQWHANATQRDFYRRLRNQKEKSEQ